MFVKKWLIDGVKKVVKAVRRSAEDLTKSQDLTLMVVNVVYHYTESSIKGKRNLK